MDLKQELGEKIKRARKKRGMTQEQLAEMINISSRNLSNIEIGVSFPKSDTLEKILTSLDISTQDLFANDHLKSNSELINRIYYYIDCAKDDNKTLEKIYKIVKGLVEDI